MPNKERHLRLLLSRYEYNFPPAKRNIRAGAKALGKYSVSFFVFFVQRPCPIPLGQTQKFRAYLRRGAFFGIPNFLTTRRPKFEEKRLYSFQSIAQVDVDSNSLTALTLLVALVDKKAKIGLFCVKSKIIWLLELGKGDW